MYRSFHRYMAHLCIHPQCWQSLLRLCISTSVGHSRNMVAIGLKAMSMQIATADGNINTEQAPPQKSIAGFLNG